MVRTGKSKTGDFEYRIEVNGKPLTASAESMRDFVAMIRTDFGERMYCDCGTELEWGTLSHDVHGDVDVGDCDQCGNRYTQGSNDAY